jgi:hypothetical protein
MHDIRLFWIDSFSLGQKSAAADEYRLNEMNISCYG